MSVEANTADDDALHQVSILLQEHVEHDFRPERLDDLLWTFRDGSFVPHHLLGTERAELPSPVTIGYDEQLAGERDLLINLCDEVPSFAEGFERVAELVTSDEDCKSKSRNRFVHYRDNGHTLDTHNV